MKKKKISVVWEWFLHYISWDCTKFAIVSLFLYLFSYKFDIDLMKSSETLWGQTFLFWLFMRVWYLQGWQNNWYGRIIMSILVKLCFCCYCFLFFIHTDICPEYTVKKHTVKNTQWRKLSYISYCYIWRIYSIMRHKILC